VGNPPRFTGFQGQYHDRETGLHYNRYRYYDPGVRRFVSNDPISYAGGLNLHQYAPKPVGWVDPLGLEGCEKACKSRNKPPRPMEAAEGRPHSIIERPGVDGQYTTHYGDGTWKQYRGSGKDHGNIPRPNIKEATKNTRQDGRVFIDKGRVRDPEPDEYPKGKTK